MLRTFVLLLSVCVTLRSNRLSADDWKQWRGPNYNNVASTPQVPVEWSSSKNVVWKAEIPGRGHASPIVSEDLVILSTADDQSQTQGIVAFDRSTGKQRWLTPVSQGGFLVIHAKNTHASSTPATDGQFIFATFAHHEKVEAVAVDRNGRIVWRKDVGGFRPKAYEYGYAASPTIYGDLLIVSADSDTFAWVKALRKSDGAVVWEQSRTLLLNWSSPIVAQIQGRDQLLLSGLNRIAAYDPQSGRPLWETKCLTMATCGTCIWDNGLIFASGGYPDSETVAVRGDGSGVVWSNKVKCYEQSMLAYRGHVYAFSDQGIVYCWEASTGKELWKHRLKGPVSSSPLLVGDVIFATNELGTTWAFRASPEKYQELSRNQLGTSGFASIAAVDQQLFIRTATGEGNRRREFLYCIGQAP